MISAQHNEGMADLHTSLVRHMINLVHFKEIDTELRNKREERDKMDGKDRIRLAICGKPNVGKSTLVNSLLGEDRVLTGAQPGVTRDSVSLEYENKHFPKHRFELVDTAGLRGVSREEHSKYSSVDSRYSFLFL